VVPRAISVGNKRGESTLVNKQLPQAVNFSPTFPKLVL